MTARSIGWLTAALLLAGCGSRQPVLHIYNWSDYMNPEVIERFEDEFEVRVVQDFYDSNEAMFAKLKAGGGGYDVIFPSSYMVNIMREQDLLLALDHSRIPNLRHIDRTFLSFTMDPDMQVSVPYMVGCTGLGVRADRLPDVEPTWGLFDQAEYAGRMTLLNDMREALGAALKYLGYSLNTTDPDEIARARDVVIGWKRNIAKFESDQYKNGLVSAEFFVSQGYSGDVLQVMEESDAVDFVVPTEGTSIASDDMVIPKSAAQVELAHTFINFLHEPEVAALNTAYVYYRCPNTASYDLLPDDVREDPAVFLKDEVIRKSEAIRDLGDGNAMYIAAWDAVKAADAGR